MRPVRPLLLGAALLSLLGRSASGQCIVGSSPSFDFSPGGQVLYSTDFSGDKVGDFPSGLEFKTGALEVGVWQGKPALKDRKSTRLNSSHSQISYAVFCLK